MVLEKLGESLRSILRKLTRADHIDKEKVKAVVKDIQRALIKI